MREVSSVVTTRPPNGAGNGEGGDWRVRSKLKLLCNKCKRLWRRYHYEIVEMAGTIIISIIVSAIVSFATFFALGVLLSQR